MTELGEYQKCPICNGVGQVSGGYFARASDYPYWSHNLALEKCQICDGRDVIARPTIDQQAEQACTDA